MAMDGIRPQSGKASSEAASAEEQSSLQSTTLTLGEAKPVPESNGQVAPMEIEEDPTDDSSDGPRRSKRKRPEDEAQEEAMDKDKKKQIKVERPSPASTPTASGTQEGPASAEPPRVPPSQSSGAAAAATEAATATGTRATSPSAGGPPTPAAKSTMKYARGSLEDLTSEVLRLLQTKGPLSLQDIVDAVPEHLREQQPSVHVVTERVLEGLRVTPLVNLVRPSPDAAALYAFLDGRTTTKPVELATVGAQLRELGQQERGAKRRIQALKAELARLDGPGVVARPEDTMAALERVLMADGLPRDAGLTHSSSGSSAGSLPQPPPFPEAGMGGQRPALYARAMETARREAARVRGSRDTNGSAGPQVKAEGATS